MSAGIRAVCEIFRMLDWMDAAEGIGTQRIHTHVVLEPLDFIARLAALWCGGVTDKLGKRTFKW